MSKSFRKALFGHAWQPDDESICDIDDETLVVTPDLIEFETVLKLLFQFEAEPKSENQLNVRLPNGQQFLVTITAQEIEDNVPVF